MGKIQLRRPFEALVVTLLCWSFHPVRAQQAPPAQPFTELTDCILLSNPANEGDSFHVQTTDGKEWIFRLYFVDTPESENSFPDRVAEQAAYFGISPADSISFGAEAAEFTRKTLSGRFTLYTRWRDALGRSRLPRFYAFVKVGPDYLQDLLVSKGTGANLWHPDSAARRPRLP